MKFNQGLSNIPLILGIVLLILAVPTAVLLVQQNQNTQNRAYKVGPVGSVDCTQILNAKINYCVGTSSSNQSGVPCSEINSAIVDYCTDSHLVVTSIPQPTSSYPY